MGKHVELASATAPGKVILFGEHAVVYGRPAIAVPVTKVQATAAVAAAATGSGCTISAPDIGVRFRLPSEPDNPLAMAVRLALQAAGVDAEPDWNISVSSTIPIAGGMGSGAAVSAVLARAVLASTPTSRGCPDAEKVNRIVYAVERIHHATPSGIDNTVVVYEQPVWFVRGRPPEFFDIAKPFHLVIADTGIASPTGQVVADVRAARQEDAARYDVIFNAIGAIAEQARRIIASGKLDTLGFLMRENQRLLRQLYVSAPSLERLIETAEDAGAAGAKLSGGGRGGNLIAVVKREKIGLVREALLAEGAARAIVTQVGG